MTLADDLRAARKLIERPECWTKDAFARLKTGNVIGPRERRAVCWCAEGAVIKIVRDDDLRRAAAIRALNKAAHEVLGSIYNFVDFNDAPTTTHADILALFDRAIAAAGERA